MKILILLYFLLDYNMCSHLTNVNLQIDQKNMVSSLYRKYMTLNNDILDFVDDTQYSNAVQSRRTFQMLESYLLDKLKDTLPVCYDAYIGLLLHDIGQFFMGNQPYPCFQIDNFVFNDILSIQTDNTGIGLLFNLMRKTVDKMNNTLNYYNQAEILITKMERQLSNYKNNNYINQLQLMQNCYDHLGTSIKSTLTAKYLSADECGRIDSYRLFLEKLSLLPLTLDKLANETSFRIQLNPLVTLGYPTDDVVGYLNQISRRNLTNLVTNTTDEIQNYTMLLKSEMTDIFNATTNEIEELIMTYINAQIKEKSKEWCFRGNIENLLHRIKHRYNILKKSCFGSLQEMVRYLEKLSKCNLRDMEIQLMTQNCQLTRTCEEISLDLTKFRLTLSSWKAVDRSYIMDYAKTCYGIANMIVINNVMKYWSRLKECQRIPFLEGLYNRLPTYREFYLLDILSHNYINKYNNIACPQVLK